MDVNRRSFLAGGMFFAAGTFSPAARARGEETYTPPPVVKGLPLRVIAEPVLQCPAPHSMGVVWAVNGLANGAVEYADNPELKNAITVRCGGFGMTGFGDLALQVRLEGLKSGTRYWYRTLTTQIAVYKTAYTIQLGETEKGRIYSFRTPGETAPARFCVMNDTHARWDQFEKIARRIRDYAPGVTIWNGDATNSTETREALSSIFLAPKILHRNYAAEAPLAFVPGNHDYRGLIMHHLDEVLMPRLPSERASRDWQLTRNFAFRLGDVALIGLDTGEDKPDWHPRWMGMANFDPYRKAQAVWLKDVLARPDIASAPYVVACCHIPLFDADPLANPGDRLENWADWQKACADLWGPLFAAHGVQVVVAAHKHQYRYDAPTPTRPWAQIVGGGPGARALNFPTLIEGEVAGGVLKLSVRNMLSENIVAEHVFKPRRIQA